MSCSVGSLAYAVMSNIAHPLEQSVSISISPRGEHQDGNAVMGENPASHPLEPAHPLDQSVPLESFQCDDNQEGSGPRKGTRDGQPNVPDEIKIDVDQTGRAIAARVEKAKKVARANRARSPATALGWLPNWWGTKHSILSVVVGTLTIVGIIVAVVRYGAIESNNETELSIETNFPATTCGPITHLHGGAFELLSIQCADVPVGSDCTFQCASYIMSNAGKVPAVCEQRGEQYVWVAKKGDVDVVLSSGENLRSMAMSVYSAMCPTVL
eukprot:250004_1